MPKFTIIALAALLALLVPAQASLASVPSDSEIDQYTESLPNGGGNDATGFGDDASGSQANDGSQASTGTVESPSATATPDSPLSDRAAAALSGDGRDGNAVSRFTRDTSLADGSSGKSGSASEIELGGVSDGAAAAFGVSSGDGDLNLLLPMLAVGAILIGTALVARRRTMHDAR